MPAPKIVAVATATPPRRFTQGAILALAGYTDERRHGFFAQSDIDGRALWSALLALSETAARRALTHVAHTVHARAVLRRHGNMSSATILFVLEETLRAESPVPGELGVMIGLGPGCAAEGALLR